MQRNGFYQYGADYDFSYYPLVGACPKSNTAPLSWKDICSRILMSFIRI